MTDRITVVDQFETRGDLKEPVIERQTSPREEVRVKILILSQYWAPENGVPQRRWSWLSKILIREGHEVTVIAPPPHYERRINFYRWWAEGGILSRTEPEIGLSGERIYRSGFYPAGASLTHRIINQASIAVSMLLMQVRKHPELKEYKPDLVIGTVPALPTAVVTQLVAWSLKAPYIIDLRDAWPELLKDSRDWNTGIGKRSLRETVLSKGPLQVLVKVTERAMYRSLRNATGIITTSVDLADHLEHTLKVSKGKKPKVIDTVRNVFPPKAAYMAEDKSSRTGSSLNVLYAGTVGRAQKLENALRAAELAQDRGYNVILRFVGDGAAWVALRDQIAEMDISATIEHRLPADDLHIHYDWADTALVHLTDWEPLSRTIPSKTYELMALGLHISAVVEGEAAQLVNKLQAGDVVEPENPQALADLWISLIEDRSQLRIPHTGAHWVECQRNEVVPAKLIDIITRAVSVTE